MNWIQKLIAALIAWLTGANKPTEKPQPTPEPEPEPSAPQAIPLAKITAVYRSHQGVIPDRKIPTELTIGQKSQLMLNIIKDRRMRFAIRTYLDGILQDNERVVDDITINGSSSDNRIVGYPINWPGTNGYPKGTYTMRISLVSPTGVLDAVDIPVTIQQTEPEGGI